MYTSVDSASMDALDYVDVPSFATRLQLNAPAHDIRPAPRIVTSLPRLEHSPGPVRSSPTVRASPTAAQPVLSPTKPALNVTQLLLSSTLHLPANGSSTPRGSGKGSHRLMTTRDPLSIPITTVNFRRFVSKTGPVFWLQDRLEEIVMWRKGWKNTTVWMAAYAFVCYFPRMIFLLPHVCVLGVLLATHPSIRHRLSSGNSDHDEAHGVLSPPPAQTGEGSVDWLANVQAIQNLMGVASDLHDFILPAMPYLTHGTPYTPIVFTSTLLTFMLLIPIVNFLPLRLTFLIFGLAPFLVTHPFTRLTILPVLFASSSPLLFALRTRLLRAIDDDRLEDKHWIAEMREVELYENERWSGGVDDGGADAGWSKTHLRSGERRAWTRGRDGWSGVSEDGSGDVSSNLTFSLSPGWSFVETEDWRPDAAGIWAAPAGADGGGWVYTSDSWLDSRAAPLEEWRTSGMTRRRRWIRRIYYDAASAV